MTSNGWRMEYVEMQSDGEMEDGDWGYDEDNEIRVIT